VPVREGIPCQVQNSGVAHGSVGPVHPEARKPGVAKDAVAAAEDAAAQERVRHVSDVAAAYVLRVADVAAVSAIRPSPGD
jgi:hypothetical protein